MLPRLVEICSSYIKPFVNAKTVLKILLIAHAFNADQLEQFCIHYFALNEEEIKDSRDWRSFKRQTSEPLLNYFMEKLKKEQEESFL